MERKKQTRRARRGCRIVIGVACVVAVALVALYALLYCADYGDGFDNSIYRSDAFAGQRVLLLVPHEDDDIGMAGATIRLYVDGGADVYVAFASNGDFESDPDVRVHEAVRALGILGVPREHVILLGYGDRWSDQLPHIYQAPGNETQTSAAGRTQTFGADGIPDLHSSIYQTPADYTRDNYLSDLNSLFTMLHPDVIFCVDLDAHPDHMGLSWMFEEALAKALKTDGDYRPKVYKGYVYALNWYGRQDFYHRNLPATYYPEPGLVNDPRFQLDQPAFDFDERVRFPAPREALSYTLRANIVYRALAAHASQDARDRAEFIINGDTVFFERRTDSLLYLPGTSITASSGDAAVLNDFKLVDTSDLSIAPVKFDKGIWTPDSEDPVRSVTVVLPRRCSVQSVSLYDNCDPDVNILSGTLQFSDGSTFPVGALRRDGKETCVEFPVRRDVASFTFTVKTAEGDAPGLSEIAAYAPKETQSPAFIKLALDDESRSFLYRYKVTAGGAYPLRVYAYPHGDAQYAVSVTEGNGDVTVENGVLTVSPGACPGKHTVTARLAGSPAVFDTVEIVVPSIWERIYIWTLSSYERLLDSIEFRLRWGLRDL